LHAHGFAPELRNASDAFSRKEFEAADVFASHDRDWFAGIDRYYKGWREVRSEIDLAAGEREGGRRSGIYQHIADIGKALSAQQCFGEILGRDADAGDFPNSDGSRFRPPFLSLRTRRGEAGGAGRRERGKEAAATL
jgi:hypothetical protein